MLTVGERRSNAGDQQQLPTLCGKNVSVETGWLHAHIRWCKICEREESALWEGEGNDKALDQGLSPREREREARYMMAARSDSAEDSNR